MRYEVILEKGDYALVIYAADKDGIRVSKMEKLAFKLKLMF